ncbi:MAG: hypothetical protein AAF960_22045 [Bacteroidota bacterium]
MENQLIPLNGEQYKSLGLTKERLYLSKQREKSFAELEKRCQNPSQADGDYMLLEKLSSMKMNTGSAAIHLGYFNYQNKKKSVKFAFGATSQSLQFMEYLGGQLNLKKTIEQEQQWMPLLKNVAIILFTLGMTYYIASMEDSSELNSSGSSRSKGGAALLRVIYDLVGPVGVTVVGLLIAAVVGYVTVRRFKHPESNVVYSKVA